MLAKKFTRRINVNGNIFLWRVATKSKNLRLVIQHLQTDGQFLIFSIPFIDPWLTIGLRLTDSEYSENEVETITPSFVRQIILFALENGWQPESKNSSYNLTIQNGNFVTQ